MLLIVWLVFLALGIGALIGGLKLSPGVGVFLFFIGAGLFLASGALLYAEGLEIEEQAIIQDAPDLNENARVIDYRYTHYTFANSLQIQVLSYVHFALGMFFIITMLLDIYGGNPNAANSRRN